MTMPKDMTKSAIERQMLDAYFHFRSNLPKKDEESGLDYKKSFKTTEDIASDLSTMATIDPETIVELPRGWRLPAGDPARRFHRLGNLGESVADQVIFP